MISTYLLRLNLKESITLSVIALLLMGYFHVTWTKNHLKEVADLKAKVATVSTELEKNRKLEANLKGKAPTYVEIQTSNDLLERYLKSNEKFSSIVDGIISNSNGREFLLSKMLAESQEKVNGYIQTLYKIEAEATFLSIGKFLEKLEDSSLLSEVQSVEIKRSANELRVCNVKINLLSYSSAELKLPLKVAPKKKEDEPAPLAAAPILGNGIFNGLVGDALNVRVPAALPTAGSMQAGLPLPPPVPVDDPAKKKKRKVLKPKQEPAKQESPKPDLVKPAEVKS